MATAKVHNRSLDLLFSNGGKLDVLLWGYQQLDKAIDEIKSDRRAEFARQRELQNWTIKVCPCGCGLKNDFCDAHLATIAAREELPF